LGISAQNKK